MMHKLADIGRSSGINASRTTSVHVSAKPNKSDIVQGASGHLPNTIDVHVPVSFIAQTVRTCKLHRVLRQNAKLKQKYNKMIAHKSKQKGRAELLHLNEKKLKKKIVKSISFRLSGYYLFPGTAN